MKNTPFATAIATALSLGTALPALADNSSGLETTLVTATRTKQTITDTLAPVAVFTREDIQRLQPTSLNDVLAQVPGITTSQDGPAGSSSSVYIRGTNNDHTLFLIDGQRFSSATLGETAIQFLDPEQIDRIEVVKGPRSNLYGSEAIGGVIQIFTKKGNTNSGSYVKAGAGSHNSQQLSGGTRGGVNNSYYAVNASYQRTDGFDARSDTVAPNNDDDGYKSATASINLGHKFSNNSVLDFSFLYSSAEEEHDNSYGLSRPYSDHVIQTVNLSYATSVIESVWFSTINIGNSIDESKQRDKDIATDKSDFKTTRYSVLWQNDFSLTDHQHLTLGTEYYDDQVDSTTVYTVRSGAEVTSRDNTAIFAFYQIDFNIVDVQLGLREDNNEEFGKTTTANAATGLQLGEKHKLIFSYGEGFKAPTFNDLYWPIGSYSYGNPDLLPETSTNYEVELRGTYERFNWSANIYRNDINNLIDWAPDANFAYTPSNIDSVRIKGIELQASTVIADWVVSGSVNYNEPENRETGKMLIKRPKKSAIFNLDKNFGKVDAGFSWRAYSERFSNSSNDQSTAGFNLVDVRLGYMINPNLKAQLKLNNLFDKDYQTNTGYEKDGFNGFVSVTYTL
ncbi:MAG: TonB-dependent receptor [Spongiibacteraceae bacterium]